MNSKAAAPAENGVLVADRVSKRFAGAANNALNEISLNVQAGEFYSFLGPSGCGKTTLLRIFAGFEEPSSGSILIDGKAAAGVPPYKRPVNMVFQSYALFPHMSVLENVAFGLRTAKRYTQMEIGEQAREALKIVRLSDYEERLPAQLSGGQQQRVALARALVMRPVVLLLDEPLSALDVRIREEMQDELSRLKRELNLTFLMVTHDQAEALAISTRVAVFNSGNLEQVGTPAEIYEHPETAFTASFIGRSNLLAGKVVESSQSIVLDCSGYRVVCATASSASSQSRFAVGQAASACFKPEAVKLELPAGSGSGKPSTDTCFSDAVSTGAVNSIPGRIESSSYQGSLVDLKIGCPDVGAVVRAVISASELASLCSSAGAAASGIGMAVNLCFDSRAVSAIGNKTEASQSFNNKNLVETN